MGEIIEALAYLFCGIYWLLEKAYLKCTGKVLGLWGTLFLLMMAALLCSGVFFLTLSLLFPAKP
jgi:hypothetical protein